MDSDWRCFIHFKIKKFLFSINQKAAAFRLDQYETRIAV